jgi:hypothetical protein
VLARAGWNPPESGPALASALSLSRALFGPGARISDSFLFAVAVAPPKIDSVVGGTAVETAQKAKQIRGGLRSPPMINSRR